MAEWMLIMLNEDDSFGESLARALKRMLLAAFVVGCAAGGLVVWSLL